MSSPRKLLRRALDALTQIEEDAERIPDARRTLEAALGPDGGADLAQDRDVVARSLAALDAARMAAGPEQPDLRAEASNQG